MADPLRSSVVHLADGRALDVLTGGADHGLTLVAQHGTPGEAHRYAGWADAVGARGLRFVAYSRPGYAGSTRRAGRTVADAAADIAELLDQLGVDTFVSLGGSGGGPHSLAAAALLPGRCLAATALVTVAPWGAGGLDWMAGMAQINLDEFGAALQGEEALRSWMVAEGEVFRHVTGAEIVAALGDALPPVDQAVMTAVYAERSADHMRRALRDGFDGWVDDDLAFARPWGFEPEEIRVPVTIWQGELDRLVPWSHGKWLAARIPGAEFRLAEGHGHFSLGETNRDEILDWLLEAGGG